MTLFRCPTDTRLIGLSLLMLSGIPAFAQALPAARTAQAALQVSMTVLASCEGRTAQGTVVCPPGQPYRSQWVSGAGISQGTTVLTIAY